MVLGACDDNLPLTKFEEFTTFTGQMPKGIQLDEFLSKRSKRCAAKYENVKQNKQIFWKLLIFEMLYLWNALPSCDGDHISKIMAGKILFPNLTISFELLDSFRFRMFNSKR